MRVRLVMWTFRVSHVWTMGLTSLASGYSRAWAEYPTTVVTVSMNASQHALHPSSFGKKQKEGGGGGQIPLG